MRSTQQNENEDMNIENHPVEADVTEASLNQCSNINPSSPASLLDPVSNVNSGSKIYLCCGLTDMRKGVHSLAMLASSIVSENVCSGSLFIFRGKNATRIKILWWDSQGFCLFYKCFDSGKFIWPKSADGEKISITKAQLSMLIEGLDWRAPKWSKPPEYVG